MELGLRVVGVPPMGVVVAGPLTVAVQVVAEVQTVVDGEAVEVGEDVEATEVGEVGEVAGVEEGMEVVEVEVDVEVAEVEEDMEEGVGEDVEEVGEHHAEGDSVSDLRSYGVTIS